jgi:hypothetical protein
VTPFLLLVEDDPTDEKLTLRALRNFTEFMKVLHTLALFWLVSNEPAPVGRAS